MGKGVPDRWENYQPYKSPVAGTRFIAFKVPLHEGFKGSLPEDLHFTPKDLVEGLSLKGLKLGIVIDLTFTKRYYKAHELDCQGVEYYKLFTQGHCVPSKHVQYEFFTVIDKFLKENEENDKLVGIHCTHGVNRTGYLVCRYMIDRLGFKAEDAIEAFNEARGYPIERENYIEDLNNPDSVNKEWPDDVTIANGKKPEIRERSPIHQRNPDSRKRGRREYRTKSDNRNYRRYDKQNGFHSYSSRPDGYCHNDSYQNGYNNYNQWNGPPHGYKSWKGNYGDNGYNGSYDGHQEDSYGQFGHGGYNHRHGGPPQKGFGQSGHGGYNQRHGKQPQDNYGQFGHSQNYWDDGRKGGYENRGRRPDRQQSRRGGQQHRGSRRGQI